MRACLEHGPLRTLSEEGQVQEEQAAQGQIVLPLQGVTVPFALPQQHQHHHEQQQHHLGQAAAAAAQQMFLPDYNKN